MAKKLIFIKFLSKILYFDKLELLYNEEILVVPLALQRNFQFKNNCIILMPNFKENCLIFVIKLKHSIQLICNNFLN